MSRYSDKNEKDEFEYKTRQNNVDDNAQSNGYGSNPDQVSGNGGSAGRRDRRERREERDLYEEPRKPKKKGSAIGNFFSTLILLIAIGVFCYAAFKLYGYYTEYKAGSDEYADLANQFIMKPPVDPLNNTNANVKIEGETDENGEVKVILQDYHLLEDPKTVEGLKEGAATKTVMENGKEQELPLLVNPVDFGELQTINPEVMGWINVNALGITYPVAQAKDNDYYLHRTFRGEEVFSGCIFLNCGNTKYMTDQNTVIYGHNMKDGSMFGKLKNMQKQEVYDSNPYFWVFTPDLIYQYRIFSCSVVSRSGDPYRERFTTEEFQKFINNSASWSYVDNHDVEVTTDDRLVTLSTCTGDDSTRFIVQGVLEQVYASAPAAS